MRRVRRFDAVKALELLPPAGEQLCKLGLLVASDDLVEGLAAASCGLRQPALVGVRRGAPTRVCELPQGITRLGLLFIYSPGPRGYLNFVRPA